MGPGPNKLAPIMSPKKHTINYRQEIVKWVPKEG